MMQETIFLTVIFQSIFNLEESYARLVRIMMVFLLNNSNDAGLRKERTCLDVSIFVISFWSIKQSLDSTQVRDILIFFMILAYLE